MKSVLLMLVCSLLGACAPKEEKRVEVRLPQIESHCTMNGVGKGRCQFTNIGDASGSVCGTIRVYPTDANTSTRILESGVFCSGPVEAQTTKEVEFTVVGVSDVCTDPRPSYAAPPTTEAERERRFMETINFRGRDWRQLCEFSFERLTSKK